jgi:serine/threonine protein kinase/formylglycine-generating enzyme required for sulfatase activity
MTPDECPSTVQWRLPLESRLEAMCAQFERSWQDGSQPSIEWYLEQVADKDRAPLLRELLLVELKLRSEAGTRAAPEEYERRFPEFTALIHGLAALWDPAARKRIGRYQVCRRLGEGGFGTVYLCFDDRAERQVAIKVPRADRLGSAAGLEAFLREARNVARLDHPNIVPLYDFGEAAGLCFLVYKFIDGENLFQRMTREPLPPGLAATIAAQVAEALHHAHGKNLFHRDIKPGNILLGADGRTYVTDFGLALPEEDLPQTRGHRSGTYPYMAPEQVRGEGHRVDGRTDIYSLGAVFYEMLTGRRPFAGKDVDVYEQVLYHEVRPPRQIRDSISRELERICLKAMARQMSARYATARDLAEELRLAAAAGAAPAPAAHTDGVTPLSNGDMAGLATSAAPSPTSANSSHQGGPLVPRGLRSFGAEDSDFFLALLPGPRDRHGLPDSIAFWKTRLESRDAERAFAVGLLYGPSGCGKSSLVKAGLLPRLSASIVPIYLEATPQNTEARLVRALRQIAPELGPDLSLPEMLAQLRRERHLPAHSKIVIVLDQFEQWLHAHGQGMESTALVAALRHADGTHVQVLLLVRDDFWMGTSRLFDLLEIHLDRERNARAVDLFEEQHARRVLAMFGQAFDRLPARLRDLTEAQAGFLDGAVAQLSQDGRIIPVRLSLFADLMKQRPWTAASLIQVGGAEGVGLRFLDETFTAAGALPDLRAQEKVVRALLQALLPETGTDLKGRLRPRQELAQACGLPENSARFGRLLEILDHDLRIITPAELEPDGPGKGSPTFSYQLTHDYLVPSLRQWLTQERRRTWRGRAELRLEERTAEWSGRRENRLLPSLREFFLITFAVPRTKRKSDERALMRAASKYHTVTKAIWLCILLTTGFGLFLYLRAIDRAGALQRAETLVVERLLKGAPAQVPDAVGSLKDVSQLALPLLREHFEQQPGHSTEKLHAAFGLAALGEGSEAFLIDRVCHIPDSEARNMIAALAVHRGPAIKRLLTAYKDAKDFRDRSRLGLVLLALGEARAAAEILCLGRDADGRTAFIHDFKEWHGDLSDVATLLHSSRDVDADLRSGVSAGLGFIDVSSLGLAEREALVATLKKLYVSAADGGTHSAVAWTLQKWRMELPALAPSVATDPNRSWFVNGRNMKLLRIPSGTFIKEPEGKARKITISTSFLMCDREVSVDLFRRFVDDADYPTKERPQQVNWASVRQTSPTADCPMNMVSWRDAVLFCNWLSVKEGKTACYRFVDENCVCDFAADGYRLPTEAEWEYAYRARSLTPFAYGSQDEHMGDYEYFIGNSKSRTWPGAHKLPNGWGLFDMWGNVSEWCWDWVSASPPQDSIDPRGPAQGKRHVAAGGHYLGLPGQRYFQYGSVGAMPNTGFRVMCANFISAKD